MLEFEAHISFLHYFIYLLQNKIAFFFAELPLKTQIVLLNPAANISVMNRLLVEPGEDIEFKCIVEGRPPPHISVYWSDGQQQRHVWSLFRMLLFAISS